MKAVEARLRRLPSDSAIAVAAVGVLGYGLVLVVFGFGGHDPIAAAAGALAAAVALIVLLSNNWLEGLAVLALSLPVPAIYTSDSLRLSLAAPVTAAVVFAWLLRWGVDGRSISWGNFPTRTTTALLGAFVLATLFARHPLVSLRESVNFALLLILFGIATIGLAQEPGRTLPLVRLLVGIAGICGALAVLESLTILPGAFPRWGTPWNRAALGFGQPNALGLFFAVLFPLAVHRATAAVRVAERRAATLAAGTIFLGLFATFSRGSWLALFAGASALLLTGDRRLLLRIWTGAFVLAIAVDVLSGGMLRDTFERTIGDWVLEQRAALMLAGFFMFLDSPIIGVGPGGYATELDRYGAQITQLWDYLDTPHNAYIQMAAEAGVIGLVAFIAFLASLLRGLVRATVDTSPEDREVASFRRALLWSFATVCFAGMVVWPFAHGTGQAVVLIAAMGMAQPLRSSRARVSSAGRLVVANTRGSEIQREVTGR